MRKYMGITKGCEVQLGRVSPGASRGRCARGRAGGRRADLAASPRLGASGPRRGRPAWRRAPRAPVAAPPLQGVTAGSPSGRTPGQTAPSSSRVACRDETLPPEYIQAGPHRLRPLSLFLLGWPQFPPRNRTRVH